MTKVNKSIELLNKVLLDFAKINRKLNTSLKFRIKFNKFRHHSILKRLSPFLLKAYVETTHSECTTKYVNNGPIWIFWWQGEENMPLIVKKCYESVKKNSCGRKVILITKYNFKSYTDISEIIIKKRVKGIITLTHFSDILRFNLLKNHGGLWIDATVYVTKKISEKYFRSFFTCCGYSDKEYFFIAKGRWTGFLIGGVKDSELFVFMDNFFRIYWSNNQYLIDYFLIDYALFFAWEKNLSYFHDFTVNNKGKDNPNLFELAKYLNQPFSFQTYFFIQENTEMYKLSYKKKIENNENNFYDILIKKDSL